MFNLAEKKVRSYFKDYMVPYLNLPILDASILKEFSLKKDELTILLNIGMPSLVLKNQVKNDLEGILKQHDKHINLSLNIESNIKPHITQKGSQSIKGVKNVIAIASGKGGVGKSTTAVNLAIALKQIGAKVGILDADIYGPSVPKMLGSQSTPLTGDENKFHPVLAHGIYSSSIAYMIDADKALVWRGPMVSRALQQLINEAIWDDLDYLVVDLPPGTGDIQLTLAEKIPVNGAVIVTTPQDISLIDAIRAISMFQKVNIPVLGVIENMSTHQCSQCGYVDDVFGQGGGAYLAKSHDVSFLGSLPLDTAIRIHADKGLPINEAIQDNHHALIYQKAALEITAAIARQPLNYSSKLPTVKVE